MLLLVGIAIFVIGFLIFMYPGVSYVTLSLLFGILIFASGLVNILIAANHHDPLIGKGWMIAGGIIEVILGLILAFNPAISAVTLPLFLGFWLLFRSFNLIGAGSDMYSSKIPGSGWTIFTGILLLVFSFIVLLQPLLYGVEVVVIWVGISFLMAGISVSSFALQLRNYRKGIN